MKGPAVVHDDERRILALRSVLGSHSESSNRQGSLGTVESTGQPVTSDCDDLSQLLAGKARACALIGEHLSGFAWEPHPLRRAVVLTGIWAHT